MPIWRYTLREHQAEVLAQFERFNVLLAHRRFGKTVLAILWLLQGCIEIKRSNVACYYYCPSYTQAKRVAWRYVHTFLANTGTKFNEAELKATLPNGAALMLGSADRPAASRGIYVDRVVLDEPSEMPPSMWTSVLRPACSDRGGEALFIGTPHTGRHGLFYEAWDQAADDPEWWRGKYPASETGIIPEKELHAAQRQMSRGEYDAEFECSFDSMVRGAYWALEMQRAEEEGRITRLPWDKSQRIHCVFDLGMNDATAIWFFFFNGSEVGLINYREYVNTGLPDIVAELRELPYQYGPWIMPHDVEVSSLSTGKTRLETLQELGVEVVVAPKLPVNEGIEAARTLIGRCVWDRENCKDGIEALRQFKAEFREINQILSKNPLHNWASHGADAFRYLAVTDHNLLRGVWGGKLDYSNRDRAVI